MVALADWKNAPGPNLTHTEEMTILTYGVGGHHFRLQVDTNVEVIDLREHLYLRMEPFSLIAGNHFSKLCGIALVDSGEQPSAPDKVENQDPEQQRIAGSSLMVKPRNNGRLTPEKTITTSKSAPTGRHPTAHATRDNSQKVLM